MPRNAKRRKLGGTEEPVEAQSPDTHDVDVEMMDSDVSQTDAVPPWESTETCQEGDEELRDEDIDLEESTEIDIHGSIPVILPRARFAGACNVETVKDGKSIGTRCSLFYSLDM